MLTQPVLLALQLESWVFSGFQSPCNRPLCSSIKCPPCALGQATPSVPLHAESMCSAPLTFSFSYPDLPCQTFRGFRVSLALEKELSVHPN